jgi:hypothetical protein
VPIAKRPGAVTPLWFAPHPEVSDIVLLEAARVGDNAGLRGLFHRYGDQVYRVLRLDIGMEGHKLAEALTETFLTIPRLRVDAGAGRWPPHSFASR